MPHSKNSHLYFTVFLEDELMFQNQAQIKQSQKTFIFKLVYTISEFIIQVDVFPIKLVLNYTCWSNSKNII